MFPRFLPMCLDALPRWIPQYYVPNFARNFGTMGATVGERAYVLFDHQMRLGRLLGKAWSRDGFIYVAERWYWYARLELLLQSCMHFAFVCVIRTGLIRASVEGAWFHEFRFDPPDLWGSPIRRHDHYVGKPPQYYDRLIARMDSGRSLFWRESNW